MLLAGGEIPEQKLDGVNQWGTLQNGAKSPRNDILLNIDDNYYHNAALIMGNWKLLTEGIPYLFAFSLDSHFQIIIAKLVLFLYIMFCYLWNIQVFKTG